MLCPNCETENRDGAKFCDECGFPLTGVMARYAKGDTEAAAKSDQKMDAADLGRAEAGEIGDGFVDDDEAVEPETASDSEDDLSEVDVPDTEHDDISDKASDEPAETKDTAQITEEIPLSEAADLSGFETSVTEPEKRLVDSSYEKPKANWRDGNTMQMKALDDDGEKASPKKKDYLASATKEKRSSAPKVAAISVAGVVAVVAVIALCTFQLHVWGGKTVPDVREMTEADATSVLQGQGFTVKSMQVKSDDTSELVLITDPMAGERAAEGSEVVIHISAARIVPDVVGKTEADATAAFASEGFDNVKFEKEASDEPEGTVLSISPEPGSRLKSTAEIDVVVSEPYIVPDVSGMYLDNAIAAIEDEGLTYEVVYIPTELYADGQMIGTQPAAGTQVEADTVVVIQIAQAISTMLENSARAQLAPGSNVYSNGYNIVIDSLDSVHYVGNYTVEYTATGRAYTQMLSGEVVYDSPTQIHGTLTFTADGQPA